MYIYNINREYTIYFLNIFVVFRVQSIGGERWKSMQIAPKSSAKITLQSGLL